MLLKYVIFILLAVFLTAMAAAPERKEVTKLPANIPTCPDDADINECIRNAFNAMLKISINGVPELNIPAIDPMTINKLNVQFSNNLIQGKAAVRNVKIAGISNTTIKEIIYQRNGKDIKMNIHLTVPLIKLDGQYRAEVQVNNAKFSSKGQFNISLIDIVSKSEHYAELYERDGHSYVSIKKINLDPILGDMRIWASGLVPEPTLNDALLEIINSNWRIIYRSVVSSTSSTWEPIALKYFNDFFGHIPFDLMITGKKE